MIQKKLMKNPFTVDKFYNGVLKNNSSKIEKKIEKNSDNKNQNKKENK